MDFVKTEFEVRKIEICIDDMIKKLESIGAKKVGIYEQKRFVYDFNPIQKGRWIRLRTNGKDTTLTIKEIKSLRIDGTKELEIGVSSFDYANEMLEKLGYSHRNYQENFRIEYTLDGVNFDLDKWPMIEPYIEIEGKSEDEVYEAINKLGILPDEITTLDVDKIYNQVYGIDLEIIKELCFSEEEYAFISKYK
jgi:adenylate cyclase class 2